MPGSEKKGKQLIKDWIKTKKVKTILDVGAGSCTYPKLLGDRYKYTAVEIWAPYAEEFSYIDYYDEVIIGDLQHLRLPITDCIIYGDVIEHINKQEAWDMLDFAVYNFNHVILSIPIGKYDSIIRNGNIYEAHLSTWDFEEIDKSYEWEIAKNVGNIGIFLK